MKLIAAHRPFAKAGGQNGAGQLPNDVPTRGGWTLAGVDRMDLQFPKFTDGRAYSQAFLLRRRLGFAGRNPRHRRRADRPAGADAAHGALTCAVLREGVDAADAQRQFDRFAASTRAMPS
jgi:hypothetical protein